MATDVTKPRIRYRCTEPLISPRAYENIKQVLDEAYLSPGRWVKEFERRWAEVCGVRYAIAASSGTASLHVAMVAAGIGSGDEVIVPAITCPDTLHAVAFAGAKPVIVDIEAERRGIDPQRISDVVTPRTKAVIPVHLYGCPVRPEVFDLCREMGLLAIEDAAEAHGAEVAGRKVGSIGDVGCFSFRGDKVIGAGKGGMITTNNERIAHRADYLIGLASPGGFDRYFSTETGFSYDLSNVHAAIGTAQIDVLEDTLAAKRRIAAWYNELLPDTYFDKPRDIPGHVWWKYSPLLKDASPREVHAKLLDQGIETMPPFVPMYRLPMYSEGYQPSDFPIAEDVYRRLLSLPSSPYLRRENVEEIVEALQQSVETGT